MELLDLSALTIDELLDVADMSDADARRFVNRVTADRILAARDVRRAAGRCDCLGAHSCTR
jgi:hypothetical protein